jgi:prepilin-type N-terminal cleavage/methylation domain-containing protein/prepilin-type processing-associated H-X9-DG protein
LKRAFTLIELLVVIAIIAILAAILFPVFAQAKKQAKKVASLSNSKEVGLAELMYMNDSDDNFVLAANACNTYPGTTTACPAMTAQVKTIGTGHADTWVYLTQPYIKNFGIMVDPGIGDNGGLILGASSTVANQDLYPEYGYNYMFLSPWYNCESNLSRNESVAVHPSSTVMFTTSQGFTTSPQHGWYDANPPGAWPITSPAPFACIWWDGNPGSGNWSANPLATQPIYNIPLPSHVTSSSRAWNTYNGANVVWVDGHAKFGTDGYLASGTDYGTASIGNAASGATILNVNNYLWTLDGTLNDLSF